MGLTGDQYVGITDKRILGYEDFGDYFLGYLRVSIEYILAKIFTKSGTFGSSKLGLDSATNDTFHLLDDGEGVSSEGHLFAYYESLTEYIFENQNGQTYDVGFAYSEYPVALAINPRTGYPEFTRYEEYCGGEATAPGAAVVDNGSNLTIVVNGTVEPGVDNSGREVRVWKNVPGPNATSMSIAVETCTVQWGDLGSGNVNYVVTTAKFGQDTVEANPGEYSCQLLGPYVSRDSSLTDSGYWFIGQITGNGPSATPTGFDLTDQQIIPFSLSESQEAANILADDANFHPASADDSDSGGIGTPYTILQDVLDAIDEALVRRRTFVTLADNSQRTIGDYIGANAIDEINTIGNGGTYFVLEAAASFEISVGGSIGSSAEDPEVLGEAATGGHEGYASIYLKNGGSVDAKLQGSFKRLHFYSGDFNNFLQIGYDGTRGECFFDQCGFRSGHAIFRGFAGDTRPIVIRNCEFAPDSVGNQGPGVAVFDMLQSLGEYPFIILENCVIRGPYSGASSQVAVLRIKDMGDPADMANPQNADSRLILFRNCHIIHEEVVGIPTVYLDSNSRQIVAFENCKIKGMTGQTQPVFVSNSDNRVYMKNVEIEAISGQALQLDETNGVLEDVTIYSGSDTTVSDPQLVGIISNNNEGMTIRNMSIFVGESSMRQGSSPSYPVIEIGKRLDFYTGSTVNVDGLYIKPIGDMHDNSLLRLYGRGNVSNFRNIDIDFSQATLGDGSSAEASVIEVEGDSSYETKVSLDNLSVGGIGEPDSSSSAYDFLRLTRVKAKNIRLRKESGTTYGWANIINCTTPCHLQDITLENNASYAWDITGSVIVIPGGFIDKVNFDDFFVSGGSNYISAAGPISISNIFATGGFNTNFAFIYVNGDEFSIRDCIMSTTSTITTAILNLSGARGTVIGNKLRMAASGSIAWILGDASADEVLAVGNVLKSTNSTTPIIDLSSGTDTLAANNILANT